MKLPILPVSNGEFIEALPGGDVLRDGISVLLTGSIVHARNRY